MLDLSVTLRHQTHDLAAAAPGRLSVVVIGLDGPIVDLDDRHRARFAALHGVFCLFYDDALHTTTADPANDIAELIDDGFVACLGRTRRFTPHHCCSGEWLTLLLQLLRFY
jgi:hypothetical protein